MKILLESVKVAVLALVITLGVTYAYAAWVGPTSAPPDGNVDAPINVGAVDQIKDGGLGVNTLAVFGNGAFSGYMKIGSTTSVCDTTLAGSLRFNTTIDNSCLQLCVDSAWQDVSCSETNVNLVISSDTLDYNIFTEVGSPTDPVNVVLTIEENVVVGSSDVTQPALNTGSLPVGSTVEIINNGVVVGMGGYGGDAVWNACQTGQDGGTALSISLPVTITNNGIIGGGGGGGGAHTHYGYYYPKIGYGGGGGAGSQVGPAGLLGPTIEEKYPGHAGSLYTGGVCARAADGCRGFGGDLGQAGDHGGGSDSVCNSPGGSAGNAVTTNGHAITWTNQGDVRGSID